MKLLSVGFGNTVSAERVIAVVAPDSAPVKRMVQDARDASRLIDATAGRRTRAVLVMDNGHIVLSAIQPETIASRLQSDSEQKHLLEESLLAFIRDKQADDSAR